MHHNRSEEKHSKKSNFALFKISFSSCTILNVIKMSDLFNVGKSSYFDINIHNVLNAHGSGIFFITVILRYALNDTGLPGEWSFHYLIKTQRHYSYLCKLCLCKPMSSFNWISEQILSLVIDSTLLLKALYQYFGLKLPFSSSPTLFYLSQDRTSSRNFFPTYASILSGTVGNVRQKFFLQSSWLLFHKYVSHLLY